MLRRPRMPTCLVGQHAVLLAGPLARQVSPPLLALLSAVAVPELRLRWQCRRRGFIVCQLRCPLGVAF